MMRCPCHTLLCVLLATVLSVAGVVQSFGPAMAGQTLVLCGADGPQTVVIGADGTPQPMAECDECPVCVPVLALSPAAPAQSLRPDTTASLLVPAHSLNWTVPRLTLRQRARAPPPPTKA